MCGVATGPNSIVVSPDWERKLLLKDRQAQTEQKLADRPQQTLEERCNLRIRPPLMMHPMCTMESYSGEEITGQSSVLEEYCVMQERLPL